MIKTITGDKRRKMHSLFVFKITPGLFLVKQAIHSEQEISNGEVEQNINRILLFFYIIYDLFT